MNAELDKKIKGCTQEIELRKEYLARAEKELADLIAKHSAQAHPLMIEYKDKDACWAVNSIGEVFKYTGSATFKQYQAQGNLFPTEAQAEAFSKYRAAIVRISRAILSARNGWEPVWTDCNNRKEFLMYEHDEERWTVSCQWTSQYSFTFPAAKPGTLAGIIEQFAPELECVKDGAW